MTRTKSGTLNPAKKEIYDILYSKYLYHKSCYKKAKDPKTKVYIIRCLENDVKEAGIQGKFIGLISEEALNTKIKLAKGKKISIHEKPSTEHPITFRSIAKFLLESKRAFPEKKFFSTWLDNLIKVKTTRQENVMLIKYQQNFNFLKNDWKILYKKAGIKLTKDHNFNLASIRSKYGITK